MKLKSTLLLSAAILVTTGSFAQYKATTNGKKYVLLEESTGPGCGYCPEGAQDIEQTIDTSVYAIIASWHDSYYDGTSMVVPGNPFSGPASSGGTSYISGDPAAAIDRTVFNDPGAGGAPAVGLNRPWENFVNTRKATTPNFDVTIKSIYKPAHGGAIDSAKNDSGTITVTVIAKALSAQTGTWNTNVFVTEDSISSAGSGFQQHSYLTSNSTSCNGMPNWFMGMGSILPAASYSHMNVVRAVGASGGSIFGDLAFTNPTAGLTVTKVYTFKFDTTLMNPKYMKVIGMVQKPGPASTTNGNTIENVIQARVRLMPHTLQQTGIEETSQAMADVTIYPNPAKGFIYVKGSLENPSDTKITIYNAVGQTVFSREYAVGGSLFGARISVDNLSNGSYFMTITNNNEMTTKEFVIQR